MSPIGSVLGALLLAFPALFSIVNPIGAAVIFSQVVADRSAAQRSRLARRVATYSLIVLLVSLWAGSYVLSFFGISLPALRLAGGLVVASRAWSLLNAPEVTQARRQAHATTARRPATARPPAYAPAGFATSAAQIPPVLPEASVATPEAQAAIALAEAQASIASAEAQPPGSGDVDDAAFFPLTMPFTTGPGTISVAVALGSVRPANQPVAAFFVGVTLAAVAIALCVWVAYANADRLLARLGPGGARTLTRLVAFLLLCIGVQIMLTGVEQVGRSLLHG